jgi:hypothetical protein
MARCEPEKAVLKICLIHSEVNEAPPPERFFTSDSPKALKGPHVHA